MADCLYPDDRRDPARRRPGGRGLGRKELSHERHRRTRGREREAEMRAGMGVLTSTSLVMVNSTPSEPGVAP